jgi:3-dehydroquinate synthetase
MIQGTFLRRVTYRHTIEYEVVNAPNLFDPENPALLSVGRTGNTRRFVVMDENVERHASAAIRDYFSKNGIEARIVTLPGGEAFKSLDSYLTITRELDAFPIHRRDEPIIAIGGGVLTDVVGFVASTYRRGLPHINVPTTLIGYVDAAIGVKTGVNFNSHKNRIGAFAPPQKVLLDRTFLKTLPRRHILNGVCEIIKLAVIKDAELFSLLEAHAPESVEARFQDDAGAAILDRAIGGMLDELQPNLLEEDLARRMDFGHTFSYGLETRPEADLLHGEAVLLDIGISTLIARARDLLSEAETGRIFQLMADLGMTLDTSLLDPCLLWASLEERTCHRNGLQRVPLPHGLGGCIFVNDITPDEIEAGIKLLQDWMAVQDDLV